MKPSRALLEKRLNNEPYLFHRRDSVVTRSDLLESGVFRTELKTGLAEFLHFIAHHHSK